MGAPTLTVPPEQEVATDPSRIITVLSPKGGAGKTSASTNLAVALAKRYPKQVVLVDLDLQFGDVASNLRLSPRSTIYDLASKWPCDSAQMKLSLTSHHTGLYALCAPNNPAEADTVESEHAAGIIQQLHRSFKFVIVDTDPGLSERVLSALDMSTDIVLVCGTEIPSIRGLRKALEALDVIGLTSARRLFLLNRSDAKTGLETRDIERIVGQDIDIKVPSSIDMVLATNDGIPIAESGRNPDIAKAFEDLADRFEPEGASRGESAKAGLRLFKRKG